MEQETRWKKPEGKAKVLLTPKAYSKILTLIMFFNKEVSWRGVARREAADTPTFTVEDIVILPQLSNGGYVTNDDDELFQWEKATPLELQNSLRLHGHSHVFAPAVPSHPDDVHRDKIAGQIGTGDFFIFTIWNKRLRQSTKVYDGETDTFYDSDEVILDMTEEGFPLHDFLVEAMEKVRELKPGVPVAPSTPKPKQDAAANRNQSARKKRQSRKHQVAGGYNHAEHL